MSIPTLPDSLRAWRKAIENRLEQLETARRLIAATIGSGGLRVTGGGKIVIDEGGQISIIDGDGTQRFVAGELSENVYGMRVATAGGGTAFAVSDDEEAPPTRVAPEFIANDTATETLNVPGGGSWVDLARSETWPVWQKTVAIAFDAANGSAGQTAQVRLRDLAASQTIDSDTLTVAGTPLPVTLGGDVPFTAGAPAGSSRQFAVQVRVTTAGPASVTYEVSTGAFGFRLAP